VDILHDNYSSFRYVGVQAISALQPLAVVGSALYGTKVHPATFEPECDAYAYTSDSGSNTTHFDAYTIGSSTASVSTIFRTLAIQQGGAEGLGDYTLEFYKNITNQPFSTNGKICDNMPRLFNTSVSAAPYLPVGVVGNVTAQDPFFPGGKTWEGVQGVRIDTAFIERNYLDCKMFAGYSGTGSGD